MVRVAVEEVKVVIIIIVVVVVIIIIIIIIIFILFYHYRAVAKLRILGSKCFIFSNNIRQKQSRRGVPRKSCSENMQ